MHLAPFAGPPKSSKGLARREGKGRKRDGPDFFAGGSSFKGNKRILLTSPVTSPSRNVALIIHRNILISVI